MWEGYMWEGYMQEGYMQEGNIKWWTKSSLLSAQTKQEIESIGRSAQAAIIVEMTPDLLTD